MEKELGHFKWFEDLSQEGVVELQKTGNVFFSNDPMYFSKKEVGDNKFYPKKTDVFEFKTNHLEPYCFILNKSHAKKVSKKQEDEYWSDYILNCLENNCLGENLLKRLIE